MQSHILVKVIDHYENPRNVGKMDPKKRNVGTGLVGAPACGDVMKLQIEVDDEGKIIDAKFKVSDQIFFGNTNIIILSQDIWLRLGHRLQ